MAPYETPATFNAIAPVSASQNRSHEQCPSATEQDDQNNEHSHPKNGEPGHEHCANDMRRLLGVRVDSEREDRLYWLAYQQCWLWLWRVIEFSLWIAINSMHFTGGSGIWIAITLLLFAGRWTTYALRILPLAGLQFPSVWLTELGCGISHPRICLHLVGPSWALGRVRNSFLGEISHSWIDTRINHFLWSVGVTQYILILVNGWSFNENELLFIIFCWIIKRNFFYKWYFLKFRIFNTFFNILSSSIPLANRHTSVSLT